MRTIVLDHPLAFHKLAWLRDEKTNPNFFRRLVHELGLLLAVEATRSLRTITVDVTTPLEVASCRTLAGPDPVVVPVLRAGLGLVEPFLAVLPTAKTGHLGLYRDHATLDPVPYYRNFPPRLEEREVFILDPMLATGGSASEAVRQAKEAGARHLTIVAILAAPEGLARLAADHPDLTAVVGAVDRQLNDRGYILPGLGDAGDRLFGTI